MEKRNRIIRLAFYSLWLAASLLQAFITPLLEDEAYYWFFSRFPAWGYYEHPPMVAFMIKAGYAIFANELGVRLVAAFMNLAAIYIAELLIKPEKPLLFYLLVSSVAVLHGLGFLAIPDAPLLLFIALFFIFYKRYLESDSYKDALLIGICAALMILSKYHGVLIIGFTLLSNIKLLKRKTLLLALAAFLVLLIPHIIWLFVNDFPIVRFHLSGRNPVPYRFEFTVNYLLSALIVFGPLIAPVLLFAGFSLKPRDLFERALKWSFIGIYIFFFLMSFRGRVEAYWTFPALIPALWFGYRLLSEKKAGTKILYPIASLSILLIIAARIFLSGGISTNNRLLQELQEPFCNPAQWVSDMSEKAGNRPVIFMNSYQDASIYSFYSGKPSMSLSNVMGRKNQFDIWDLENRFRGREVMVVPNFEMPGFDTIGFSESKFDYTYVDNFQVFPGLMLDVGNLPAEATPGETVRLKVTLHNPKEYHPDDLIANPEFPSFITYQFFKDGALVLDKETGIKILGGMIGRLFYVDVVTPEEPGNFTLHLSVKTGWLPSGINSREMTIFIR